MKIKITTLIIAVMAIVTAMVYDLLLNTPNQDNVSGANGNNVWAAPVVSMETINGANIDLSQFKGKNVLLNFWATWCYPCTKELPEFTKFVNERNGDVVLIAVSVDDIESVINEFVNNFSLNQPNIYVVWDKTKQLKAAYNSYKVPETIVIDKNGNMVKKFVGYTSYDELLAVIPKI